MTAEEIASWYDQGEEDGPKEEPNCGACCDTGQVPRDKEGRAGLESEPWTWTHMVNCPECRPTAEQVAARDTEYARAVAAREIDPTEQPF